MLALALLVVIAALLLVVLTSKIFTLSSQFRDIEERLRLLERKQQETSAAQPTAALPLPGLPLSRSAVTSPPPVPSDTRFAPAPVEPVKSPIVGPEPAPEVPSPSRTREEWEALIGGKLLNRIGALALIIGVGFFLKHAIDNAWINELTRVLIGAATGSLCLLGGERARRRGFQVFSQGLVGAGLAILYLSVYASFNFYQLVSLPVAFGLMGAITVLAFLEALWNSSLAVSLLACIGGLLTPVMLSGSESNEVGLFGYLVALNVAIPVILRRKPEWVALEPLSLAGTCAVYFLWFFSYYTTTHTLAALLFLLALWGLYHGLDFFRSVAGETYGADLHRAVGWFNAAVVSGALYGICIPHGQSVMALVAMVGAAFYIGSAFSLERLRRVAQTASFQFLVTGTALLAWAVALEFRSFTIILFWTLEATVLVWMGTQYRRRYVWATGLVLLAVTAIALLALEGSFAASSFEGYRAVLNMRALAFVIVAASVGASALLLRSADPAGSAALREVLHYAWIMLVFIALTVETNDLFRSHMINVSEEQGSALGFERFMVMAAVWSIYGLVLVWVSRHAGIRPVVYAGIALVLLAAILAGMRGIAYDPLTTFTPAFNVRAYVILLVAGVLFLTFLWLRKVSVESTWIPDLREAMLSLGVILLLVLFTGETRDLFEQAISMLAGQPRGGPGEAERLENLKQLSLSGVWLVFSIAVMAFGIWRRMRVLRLMAMITFGISILKVFIYDLSFLDTLYRIFSFIALGLILLAVSYLYQRYRSIILGPSDTRSG